MFNSFRRAKRDTIDDTVDAETHRKWLAVSNSVTGLLAMQRVLLPSDFAQVVDGDINKNALGYVWGFVDTALHNAGLPLLSSRGRILLTNVLDMLQDGSSEFLNARLPTMSGDAAFTNAAKIGGTEYWNWLTNKTPPLGLGR